MDHTSAVIDVDYAPTGREFVSGSYDKTIRIFESLKGHSRDVYHTKRMQRLTCVKWSLDNKYILSGSDEMNIRMWKARASEKLGVVSNLLNYGIQTFRGVLLLSLKCIVRFITLSIKEYFCVDTFFFINFISTKSIY